jgi:hypothetical protein
VDPSKAVELMQIYLAERRRGMSPDDIAALGILLKITGIFIKIMGARRARDMLIRGGDFIGYRTNESQQLAQQKRSKV